MLQATRQEFTTEYRAEWRRPDMRAVVHVALIVVDDVLNPVLAEGRLTG